MAKKKSTFWKECKEFAVKGNMFDMAIGVIIGGVFKDLVTSFTDNIIMPIVALVTAIFVGYFIKPKTVIEEVELTGKFKWSGLFTVMIRYIAPVIILVILISSVLSAFGKITI